MTNDEKRIAILEFQGWKPLKSNTNKSLSCAWECPEGELLFPPDPLTSLDAMHEAEKQLPDTKFADYFDELARICIPNCSHQRHWHDDIGWIFIDATASQRADALLKTIGKLTTQPENERRT